MKSIYLKSFCFYIFGLAAIYIAYNDTHQQPQKHQNRIMEIHRYPRQQKHLRKLLSLNIHYQPPLSLKAKELISQRKKRNGRGKRVRENERIKYRKTILRHCK
ncbi:hypothetical protein O5584_24025 [Escherichia coli]|nr:hypothetical protein [Escherichia coli]